MRLSDQRGGLVIISLEEVQRIRDLYIREHKSITDISTLTGRDYKTIKKYLDKDDFSPQPFEGKKKEEKVRESILDEFKPKIDEMLEDDLKNGTHKQRHTATRVFERLRDEYGYTGGQRIVSTYVKKRRAELGFPKKEAYVPLCHSPGESQGDFGECENFIIDGVLTGGAHFSLSFPYSNAIFIQATYGMNLECLMESLQNIFEFVGGVPREIWLDNATSMVSSLGKTVDDRKLTDRFLAFTVHYRLKTNFANPESGNEKGNVERSVGSSRHSLLVPVPRFLDMGAFNQKLLNDCITWNRNRDHYIKGEKVADLFEEDKKNLLVLPSTSFDTADYKTVSTDKCGRFTLEGGKHVYSSSPEMASSYVNLKITSGTVTVMDHDNKAIVVHKRLYGGKKEHKESMIWLPYLDLISRKPRSWMNSGFVEMVPEDLNEFIRKSRNSDRGKVLKFITRVTKEKSFEEAVYVVTEALHADRTRPEDLEEVYHRLYSDQMPDQSQFEIPAIREDLSQYGDLLGKEEDEDESENE